MANYNESRVYKIWCNLSGIDEIYVGSSVNFVARCLLHRSDCNNINSPRYDNKLYNYIRNNGGFENFNIHVLEIFPCKNYIELHQREQKWIDELKPTLNNNKSYQTNEDFKNYMNKYMSKIIYCNKCNKKSTIGHISRHKKSKQCKKISSSSSSDSFIFSDSDTL